MAARKPKVAPVETPGEPLADRPAANAERGEDSISLDGVAYRLRPSFEANQAVEKLTGQSLIELYNEGSRGALSLENLGIIVAQWIKAGAEDETTRNVGARRIAELIYDVGQVPTTVGITSLLNEAISGGRTSSGERKAVSE